LVQQKLYNLLYNIISPLQGLERFWVGEFFLSPPVGSSFIAFPRLRFKKKLG